MEEKKLNSMLILIVPDVVKLIVENMILMKYLHLIVFTVLRYMKNFNKRNEVVAFKSTDSF